MYNNHYTLINCIDTVVLLKAESLLPAHSRSTDS